MNNSFMNQLKFSLDNAAQDSQKVSEIRRRIHEIENGDLLTLHDILAASVCFDLESNGLLKQAVLGDNSNDLDKLLSDCINKNDINGVAFMAANCIVRINDEFYFFPAHGKIDTAHPVDEALLERTRSFLIDNDLPIHARRLSSPSSFFSVDKLPENDKIINTIAAYMFGAAGIPNPDIRTVACFNKLSSEADKKRILQWVLQKLNQIKDPDLNKPISDTDGVWVRISETNNAAAYAPLYFTDLYDLFDTANEEKQQIQKMILSFREKTKKL